MKPIEIYLPLNDEDIKMLKVGDYVLLSGYVYTMRDVAHRRIKKMIRNDEKLPFDLKNQTIFYTGPTPNPPERVIGSIGPTTSTRMDKYTGILLENGVNGMIGKGKRRQEVIDEIEELGAVYFVAVGGISAVLSECVVENDLIAFPDLGPEAIYRLKLKEFPCIVAIDSEGNDIFKEK